MRFYFWLPVALVVVAFGGSSAQAQFRPNNMPGGIGYTTTPTVSPYLQLNRTTSGAQYLNYYGLVRPAFDTQNAINGLQQQISDAQSTGTGGTNGLLTGSRPRFLNTGNFFLSTGGQGMNNRGSSIIVVGPQQNQSMTTNFQNTNSSAPRR